MDFDREYTMDDRIYPIEDNKDNNLNVQLRIYLSDILLNCNNVNVGCHMNEYTCVQDSM